MSKSLLPDAYQLPMASYVTKSTGHIESREIVCTHVGATGMSNATSTMPVIGTVAFNPCTALILYNRKSKVAVVIHLPELSPRDMETALSKIRTQISDHVDAHLFGAPYNADRSPEQNDETVVRLNSIVEKLNEFPNCRLKTFDVYDKPKPWNVAIDTRSGKLIRGSELFCNFSDVKKNISETTKGLAEDWKVSFADFDGTAVIHQQSMRL